MSGPRGPRDPPRGAPADPRVVPAKIRAPVARVDVVERRRLLDRLDDARRRLVLISAPAGFGKTVLVADWLRRSGRPAAWLSLDPLDDDPGRFCAHLAASLREASGGWPASVAESIARAGRTGGTRLGPALASGLAGGDEDAVLVLDDVHHLESGVLVEMLDALIQRLGHGPRVVLLTRVDPPVRLGRIRLSGGLLEIRERDLRFTREEALELFAPLASRGLTPELAARLDDRAEGWVAALRMAAVVVAQTEDPGAAVEAFSGSHELVVDYLMEEILAGRDGELQRFLMETSVLPRFTAEGCREVTGDPAAGRHLRAVDEANLFLITLDERRGWYRYHHLFAELLTYRLRRLAPEREQELRERASRWLEARGDVEEAMAQAASIEDPRRLVELLDRHGYSILARSEFAAFARWLGRVPDPLAWRWPMFLVAVAWYRLQTVRAPDLDGMLGALVAALEDPVPDYPPRRLEEARRHLDALRAFALRMSDRLDEAAALGEEVLAGLPPGASAMRGVLEFNLGAVYLRAADMERARRWLERAHESCLGSGPAYLVLASLAHLGAVAAHSEGLESARQRLESAVAFAEDQGLDGLPAFAIVLYQLAQVHWLADEPARARPWIRRALELTRGEAETDIRANVLIHKARVDLVEGLLDEAEEALVEATALAHAHNVKPFATSLEVERARLAEARTGRVQPLPETSAQAPPDDGSGDREGMADPPWTTVREAETAHRLRERVARGAREEAGRIAALLRRASEARGRGVALCAALLGQAATAADARERREALAAAVELASVRGYLRPILDTGSAGRALLERAVVLGELSPAARDFVQLVLPRMPVHEEARTTASSDDSELTDRELETLAHLASGRTNKAIARRMFVSTNTVKTHLKRIYAKLGVSTRTQAVERGHVLGLIAPPGGVPEVHPEDHPNG